MTNVLPCHHQGKVLKQCVCHVGVNTDVVKVDKGNSIHLQFEDKSVNTDDIFQVQQGSLDETKNEVSHLKQENVPLKEELLRFR